MTLLPFPVLAPEAGHTLAKVLRSRLHESQPSWNAVRGLIQARRVRLDGEVCTDEARRLREGEQVELLTQPKPLPKEAHSGALVVPAPGCAPRRRREAARREHGAAPVRAGLVAEAPRTRADRARPGVVGHRPTAAHEAGGIVPSTDRPPARQGDERLARLRPHGGRRTRPGVTVQAAHRRPAVPHARLGPLDGPDDLVEPRQGPRRRDGGAAQLCRKSGSTRSLTSPAEERIGAFTLLSCRLETGRTHQIRIHLSEAGYPVCGDKVYCKRPTGEVVPDDSGAPRLMLHATELGFEHPVTGVRLHWSMPVPADMAKTLDRLRGQ